MCFRVDKGNLGTIGGESAWVSGLEDPLTSREPTTPHTGCREEDKGLDSTAISGWRINRERAAIRRMQGAV
jgi:hypothetical protein